MRPLLIIALFFLTPVYCISQKLDGEWKGTFTDPFTNDSYPIKLYFVSDKWYTYKVYSYSKGNDAKGNDTTVVCSIFYKTIWKDSIYLEETKVLLPKKITPACFQKMFLKIKKKENELMLEGKWENVSEKCGNSSGVISFIKQ